MVNIEPHLVKPVVALLLFAVLGGPRGVAVMGCEIVKK